MTKREFSPWLVVLLLLGVGVAGRLLPHPHNVAPIASVALFAGFYFSNRARAALLPLTAMLLSDLFLGVYDIRIAAVVYLAFTLPVLFGGFLQKDLAPKHPLTQRFLPLLRILRLVGAAMAASLSFFLLSNLAVWFFGSFYPHTWQGLIACYVAALPFLHLTVVGDLAYTTLLFGAYATYLSLSSSLEQDALSTAS